MLRPHPVRLTKPPAARDLPQPATTIWPHVRGAAEAEPDETHKRVWARRPRTRLPRHRPSVTQSELPDQRNSEALRSGLHTPAASLAPPGLPPQYAEAELGRASCRGSGSS